MAKLISLTDALDNKFYINPDFIVGVAFYPPSGDLVSLRLSHSIGVVDDMRDFLLVKASEWERVEREINNPMYTVISPYPYVTPDALKPPFKITC